jgi:hypothetical protein
MIIGVTYIPRNTSTRRADSDMKGVEIMEEKGLFQTSGPSQKIPTESTC